MKKKIALIQMQVKLADPDFNYSRAEKLLEKAMEKRPDIIVLPETWNTGFYMSRKLKEIADEEGKQTRKFCADFAKENHVNIVAGSATVRQGDSVYNRAYVFDREGKEIGKYDKMHGFSFAKEPLFFEQGNRTVHFHLDGLSCSMAICYDIRFPEWIRRQVLAGETDLFFVPAAWPEKRLFHWTLLNQARAVENQMYLCAVNQGGVSGGTQYAGNSVLLDPWGEDVCRLGTEEEIAVGEIDTEVIQKIRNTIYVFKDRRPEFDVVK